MSDLPALKKGSGQNEQEKFDEKDVNHEFVSKDSHERAKESNPNDVDQQQQPPPNLNSHGRQTADTASRRSLDLTRTTSTALSRVASRLTTTSHITHSGPPPDGGLQAWTQVAMGWLIVFTSWGFINSYGAFQTYYTLTLAPDVAPSTISWIGTTQNFLTFFLSAFSGRLLDAGLYVPTLLTGVVLQLLGIFTLSLATRYWQLMLTQGVLTGIGSGIFFAPSMGLVSTYFDKKRAAALGILTTGNSVGGMIYPIIARELLPKLGFAWTVRVLGFLNLGLLALAVALIRPRLPPRRSSDILDLSAFRETPYTLFCVGAFFAIWAIYYTFYYLGSFGVQAIGLPYSQATVLIILVNASGVIARIIPGIVADRYGQINTVAILAFALCVVSWTWLAVDDSTGIYIWTCFYGSISSAFQSLIPSTVAYLTKDPQRIGTRLGMVFTCVSFAALTGSPIGGALQNANGGSFLGPQAWAASSCVVCCLVIGAARMEKAEWRLVRRV